MYQNREDAGRRLALSLNRYKDEDCVVLGIAMGGMEIGYQVARYLDADFSPLMVRKLSYPKNPESGFGAIAEDGSIFIFPYVGRTLHYRTIDKIVEMEREEVQRRVDLLRDGEPLPDIRQKTVILVDDGIAKGGTIRAATMLCRKKGAQKLVIGTPVANAEMANDMADVGEDSVVLTTPKYFKAIPQVYRQWREVGDQEGLDIMEKWRSQLVHATV
ncbi:Putative phosphoribosyl transferase [Anaerohalosphaera lusitana]|uniref:Putative phosphoribosyl transferase n=1 Tax=Anaerohalosphaera lusitana TaxID=1936003 RepID=A0A1U9NJ62_9BACT|nr:phosphoribosyltransferase family protein [Anaerohalosphaera lusitana]AQT67973.1 Putative phosphoribosyl transferase [Anaerohalosphaera lusitana]